MKLVRFVSLTFCILVGMTAIVAAGSISMKLSGEGAVNDSTIKAGQPVSLDIYIMNDSVYTGFSFGFKLTSKDIKKIGHPADSGKGLNEKGDIRGYNGWEDKSIWNYGGVFVVDRDWDGEMPELIGFGGIAVQQDYKPHEKQKCLSIDLLIPTPGMITVDSSFYPPGGRWLFAGPKPGTSEEPAWGGPYTFNVVK
jgi:hypothetical protein